MENVGLKPKRKRFSIWIWGPLCFFAVVVGALIIMLPTPTMPIARAVGQRNQVEIGAWLRWRKFGIAPTENDRPQQQEIDHAFGELFSLGTESLDMAFVERLLSAGANIDATSWMGNTLLGAAAADGDEALVDLLLSRGASIDHAAASKEGEHGRTPFFNAVLGGHEEIALKLLAKGADPNAVDKVWGVSALMESIKKAQHRVTRALVEAGVDVNHKAINGSTAASFAYRQGDLGLLQYLLESGARKQDLPGVLTHPFEDSMRKSGVKPDLSRALKPSDIADL